MTGNVLIVSFSKPLLVTVDRLAAQAAGYIGAARRDPDDRAVRMALARKVTVHSIAAGDEFFVDLLPDTWSGAPPPLPQEVIKELARRAREAERLGRLARLADAQKQMPPVRVPGRQPAHLHPLYFRGAGTDLGVCRHRQGPPHADLRCPNQVRFRRRRGGVAADDRGDQVRGRRPFDAGALCACRQGRCAYLPRRQELCCGCRIFPTARRREGRGTVLLREAAAALAARSGSKAATKLVAPAAAAPSANAAAPVMAPRAAAKPEAAAGPAPQNAAQHPAAANPAAAKPAAPAPAPAAAKPGIVGVELARHGANLKLSFPYRHKIFADIYFIGPPQFFFDYLVGVYYKIETECYQL